MKAILLVIAIAASSYFFYSNTAKDEKSVDVRGLYTYEEVASHRINTTHVDYLTDVEYYILESLKRTNYTFYVIGGWVRDRVYIFNIVTRKRT